MMRGGSLTSIILLTLLLTAAAARAAAKSPAELARRLPDGMNGVCFADCARISSHPVLGPAVRSLLKKYSGKLPGSAARLEDAAKSAAAGFVSDGRGRPPRVCAWVELKPDCGLTDAGRYPELPARIAAYPRNNLAVTLAEPELIFVSMYADEAPVPGRFPVLADPRLLRVIASGESGGAAAAAYLPNPREVLSHHSKSGGIADSLLGDVTTLEAYAWIPADDPSGLVLKIKAETPNPMVLAARLRTMFNAAGKVFFARDRRLFTRMMKGIRIGIGNGSAVMEARWDGEIVSALGRVIGGASANPGLKRLF